MYLDRKYLETNVPPISWFSSSLAVSGLIDLNKRRCSLLKHHVMFSIRIHAGNTIQSRFHTALEDDPIGDTDIRNIYVGAWPSERRLQAGCCVCAAAILVRLAPAHLPRAERRRASDEAFSWNMQSMTTCAVLWLFLEDNAGMFLMSGRCLWLMLSLEHLSLQTPAWCCQPQPPQLHTHCGSLQFVVSSSPHGVFTCMSACSW